MNMGVPEAFAGREAPDSDSSPQIDLAALGECMVELSANGEDLQHAAVLRRHFGGDTLNVAAMAAIAGMRTAYISAVGADPFGRYLVDAITDLGVDTSSMVTRSNTPTGVYFVETDATADRRFYYYRTGSAASTFAPRDLDRDLLTRVQVLHVSGITQALSASMRASTLEAASSVRRHSGKVSYDPNFRRELWSSARDAREAFEELMPVDLFFPSASDLHVLYPGVAVEGAAERLLAAGVETVLVKAGASGSYLATEETAQWVDAVRVDAPKDTTGAGDFAVGSFLACFLRSWSPVQAAQAANTIAAETIRRHGSVGSVVASDVHRHLMATEAESQPASRPPDG